MTGTGKSFLKKKQPPPEHSTPIRDDKPTLKSSIGADKPSPIEANDDGSGSKSKSKTKKEVLTFKLQCGKKLVCSREILEQ